VSKNLGRSILTREWNAGNSGIGVRFVGLLLKENDVSDYLSYEMWFEQPQGMTFKVTVSVRNAMSSELMELVRMNWDCNVAAGCRALSARP
jgi:hypothetical protein